MRRGRTIAAVALACVASGLAGCQTNGFRFQVPQVQQASEAIESGGDRQRRYNTCSASNATAAEVIPCMEAAGYGFIPRDPGYPAAECWRRREGKDDQLVGAFCFRKAKPDEPAPPAPPAR
jgi:hypothetical protein